MTMAEMLIDVSARGFACSVSTCRSGWKCGIWREDSDENAGAWIMAYGLGDPTLAVAIAHEIFDSGTWTDRAVDVPLPLVEGRILRAGERQ